VSGPPIRPRAASRQSAALALAGLLSALPVRAAQEAGAQGAEPSDPPPTPSLVIDYGRFGSVSVYRPEGRPRELVLFLSGDGGWNLGVLTMARLLRERGALVAGIDIRHYLAELEHAADACVTPAADLEALGRFLEAKLELAQPLRPTLVGYSSGASLVYAALAQSSSGTFKGALSLGFCEDLDLDKPLCKGTGMGSAPKRDAKGRLKGVNLLPSGALSGQWISLQGELDQVCPAAPAQKFIADVPGAKVVLLPKVGHGYSVEHNWAPEYEAAFREITADEPPESQASSDDRSAGHAQR
jgi:type IV secretory pathway VirJ component